MTLTAAFAFGAAPASAQCGQTTNVRPRVAVGPGPPPLAVGDSVLYDAAQALSSYGFQINAMVCRTMAQGIVLLENDARSLPSVVVVALGTNGAVTAAQIDQLLAIVGPTRVLAMVTPYHGNYAYVPNLIRSVAAQDPGRILVLNWDQVSAGHPDWFAPDGIHLGGTAGINAYARLVASALLATPAGVGTPTIGTPTTIQPAPAISAKPRPPSVRSRAERGVRLAASAVEDLARWLAAV